MTTIHARKSSLTRLRERGKVGYALAWLLGIPIPVLLVVYAISRCT